MYKKRCDFCGIEYKTTNKSRKFCSISCSTKRQIRDNPDYGLKKGHKLRNGLIPWNKGMKNKELSIKQSENNIAKRPEVREKISESLKRYYKNNHPWNFKTGNSRNRKYLKTKWFNLIKEIYKRDNYTCQICGKKGGILNAHHILDWASYPEKAFKKVNIVTLCIPCHSSIHYKKKIRYGKNQEVMQ